MITTGGEVTVVCTARILRTWPKITSMTMRVVRPMTPAARVGGWPMITRPATAPNMMMTTASNVDQAVRIRVPNSLTSTRKAR